MAEEPQPETAEIVPVRSDADLAMSVDATQGCEPGGECAFEVRLRNQGAADFDGPILVTDTISSSGASYVGGGSEDWSCEATGDIVFCRDPEAGLPAGEETSFRIRVRAADDYGSTRLRNCAGITWLGLEGRDRIRAVQAQLRQQGFEPGAVDGILGPNTSGAIADAQRANGLPDDGSITPALVAALFGDGAVVEGDAGGDNDSACADATVTLPEPRAAAEPQPEPQAQSKPQRTRPSHAADISAFHRQYESRYHDPDTSTPVEMHEPRLSRFHQTYASSLHNTATSEPRMERSGPARFHDGTYSRFRSTPNGGGVHEPGTSRLRPIHDVRMSSFHQRYSSSAHDARTSQPVSRHDSSISRFHDTAPSSLHDPRTSRGRRDKVLQHDRSTSRVRPAY